MRAACGTPLPTERPRPRPPPPPPPRPRRASPAAPSPSPSPRWGASSTAAAPRARWRRGRGRGRGPGRGRAAPHPPPPCPRRRRPRRSPPRRGKRAPARAWSWSRCPGTLLLARGSGAMAAGMRTGPVPAPARGREQPDSPGPHNNNNKAPHYMDGNLHPGNSLQASRRQSAAEQLEDGLELELELPPTTTLPNGEGAKPKKLAIAEYISRNFFTKKTKETIPSTFSAPGWKLFGKIPPRENSQKDSKTIQQEYEARTGRMTKIPLQRRRNLEFEPLSTTALILEDRPAHLPAKSAEEAQRHRQEYDEMVAEAKKREVKEAQRRKKIMKERFRQEENIAHAMIIWNTDILPNWETIRNTRKVRELWWQGIPPSVRGKVWSLAVGNELNITHELYEIFLSRAKERWKNFSEVGSENETEEPGASGADREASLELIKLDISRTFPSLFIFQKGGPYHDLLHSVLGAYTCYRPDVGYVQGMSFVAAVLILNLEEADAFIAFANLLNKPCQLAFFRVDHDMMLKYFASFEVFFEENLPKLFVHFMKNSLTPDIYLIDWIFTLYSKSLPLDLACRVWDVFCRDGEEFLFRTALGILKLYEEILVQMDFIHIAQFLTKLPEDITSEKLFACITTVQMHSSNKKWTQVFASLMKENREIEKNHSPALKS
ncbi:TBC1 domain family member 12 isoform X2 [Leucoraja erinacea]|uniref:TBC1 domain family member 12 isoform X2 n=1 Tax=Leucoraja erinaceus TaxID=7782 RepID=UPI002453A276|nr:TBC1 domain family member 12 isoform X2 [Leucoraja erinacea]